MSTTDDRGGRADADCTIRTVRARRVWDSRGRPTVEAEIALAATARSAAPSSRPARRRERARRTSCATAARRSAAST